MNITELYKTLLLLCFICIYKYNSNTLNCDKFYNLCLKSKYNNITIYNNNNKFVYGKNLWETILKEKNTTNTMCLLLKNMNLFKYNTSFYYHRLYSLNNKTNIKVKGRFPDRSYYRLVPKNKYNYNNIMTNTYEVQNFIFNYQHPLNCNDKKYLIIKGYESGHGSEIHVLTSYLSLALYTNRIAIFDPYYITLKALGKFCKREQNWLCFLEQLTNCSLTYAEYINSSKYINSNQPDRCLYISGVTKFRYLIPSQIINLVKDSPLYQNKLLHYWRIQAATYIFRLNRKTDKEIHKLIHKSLKDRLFKGCFNIWVRHGDKYKEMKLLNSEDYIPSYNIYKSLTKSNIPIYLSTDDNNVIEFFDSLNNTKVYYLKFLRKNDNFQSNMKRGDEMTLNFIADIKAALYCNGFSGTRKSNVVRLIDELRSTVGLASNAIYFENGNIKFSDTSYENYEFW